MPPNSDSDSDSSSEKDLSTLAGISTIIDEEIEDLSELDADDGTLKNIDLLNLDTEEDVTSLETDPDESTLMPEDSLISSNELQSAVMLYNDGFPSGQETTIENGKIQSEYG